MPLVNKPKEEKKLSGNRVFVTKLDMIKCCMCKPKDQKHTFKFNHTGSSHQYYCKNCGYQLTWKQIDEYRESAQYKKDQIELGIKS
jgi:hypothetical protein